MRETWKWRIHFKIFQFHFKFLYVNFLYRSLAFLIFSSHFLFYFSYTRLTINAQKKKKKAGSFASFWQNHHVFMHSQWHNFITYKNQQRENSVLPIYSEIFFYLSRNSKINWKKMLTLIVKRLQFNRFLRIIIYLCNQSHTHEKEIAYFKNSAAEKLRQKSEFYLIFCKVIALKKKNRC